MPTLSLAEPEWLRTLSKNQPKAEELMARTAEEQRRLGYFHTLRAISHRPGMRQGALTGRKFGSQAKAYRALRPIDVKTMDEGTNEDSLVISSGLTELVVGARFQGLLDEPETYRSFGLMLS